MPCNGGGGGAIAPRKPTTLGEANTNGPLVSLRGSLQGARPLVRPWICAKLMSTWGRKHRAWSPPTVLVTMGCPPPLSPAESPPPVRLNIYRACLGVATHTPTPCRIWPLPRARPMAYPLDSLWCPLPTPTRSSVRGGIGGGRGRSARGGGRAGTSACMPWVFVTRAKATRRRATSQHVRRRHAAASSVSLRPAFHWGLSSIGSPMGHGLSASLT